MLGIFLLLVLAGIEVGYVVYSLYKKSYQADKKSITNISLFALLSVLALVGVIHFGFQWYMLFVTLAVKAALGIWFLLKRKSRKIRNFTKKHVILSAVRNIMLVTFAVVPVIMFPQFKPVEATGSFEVASVSYTLTDPNRVEAFSDKNENRKVTIQFWYPENADGQYPLVVFSHGAFGFRGSNRSTFENLASNGYVVCSIDHTYHSFFTKQTDGKTVIADMEFINNAMGAQNDAFDDKTTYDMSHEWLKLRLDDVNFVIDTILNHVNDSDTEQVYQLINPDKIGVFGHSLGGATSAEIGRERTDVDAVIVVDGTMFGEETAFENGAAVLNSDPYPVPLLNIYNEEHYKEAQGLGSSYPNISATENAVDARETVFIGAGHLNFTDLPLFSPFLAGMLGTGDIDSRYCIETTNQVILDYFNHYLKDIPKLNLQEKY